MATHPTRAELWVDAHHQEMMSIPLADAIALVNQAGLHPSVIKHPWGWRGLAQQPDHVDLWLGPDGALQRITAS